MKKLMTVLTLVIALTTACEKSENSNSPKSDKDAQSEERLYKTPEQDSIDMEIYRSYLSVGFPESLTESIDFLIDDLKSKVSGDTAKGLENTIVWNHQKNFGGVIYIEADGKPLSISITDYTGKGYKWLMDMGADGLQAGADEMFYSDAIGGDINKSIYPEDLNSLNIQYKEMIVNIYSEFNYPEK